MTYKTMLERARDHVARHLNCPPDKLLAPGTSFVENRRAEAPFLEICTMGAGVVVSASPELLPRVEPLLTGKSRDEVFEFPLVYGQSLYYLPDLGRFHPLPLPEGYRYRLLAGEQVKELRGITGFDNSLAFDAQGETPTCIVFFAERDGEVAGLAGAAPEGEGLWEMGVDVGPAFRRGGLGAALVSHLAAAILERDVVPFYCASVTNIGSQGVAFRAGLVPAWVSTYRTVLDGSFAYGDLAPALPE